jgi:hypothetical protein
VAGGNIDLRACLDSKQALFMHDIPAFFARNIKNLKLNNFQMEWGKMTDKFYTHGIQISDFENVQITNFSGESSPSNPKLSSVYIENGKGLKSDLNRHQLTIKNVNK